MTDSSPTLLTPDLLDTFRSHEHLPDDVWYIVVATTLAILNRPEEIQAVYRHAVAPQANNNKNDSGVALTLTDDEQLRIARRMREALLKTSAIGGLPKSINALQELKKAVPPHLSDDATGEPSPTGRRQDIYETPDTGTSTSAEAVLARGEAFFDRCYGKVAGRVRASLDGCGAEDLGLVVRLAYGYVLSPTAVLSEVETSFVMIAGLVPQDVNPQLKGHLKGALNGGASTEGVRAVRQVSIDVCHAAGMSLLPPAGAAASGGGWGWRVEVQDL